MIFPLLARVLLAPIVKIQPPVSSSCHTVGLHGRKTAMKMPTKIGLLVLAIGLAFLGFGCDQPPASSPVSDGKENTGSGPLRFADSNDKVIYAAYWGASPWETSLTVFVVYDLTTKEQKFIRPPKNIQYGAPSCSPDGKKITFPEVQGNNSNICIMNTDGSAFQQLTHDYSDGSTVQTPTGEAQVLKYNTMPSFSPDGRKILFAQANRKRKRAFNRGTMLSKWDIYEVEIETKSVRRLTNFQFYDVSAPYYMPDGKRFIFWGMAPDTMSMDEQNRYREKYKDNWIFIMDGENAELKPAIVHGSWTCEPSVSEDGAILFVAKTNELDELTQSQFNYDLFLKKEDKFIRITTQQGYIDRAVISPYGYRILFSSTKKENARSIIRDYIVDVNGANLTEIHAREIGIETAD